MSRRPQGSIPLRNAVLLPGGIVFEVESESGHISRKRGKQRAPVSLERRCVSFRSFILLQSSWFGWSDTTRRCAPGLPQSSPEGRNQDIPALERCPPGSRGCLHHGAAHTSPRVSCR